MIYVCVKENGGMQTKTAQLSCEIFWHFRSPNQVKNSLKKNKSSEILHIRFLLKKYDTQKSFPKKKQCKLQTEFSIQRCFGEHMLVLVYWSPLRAWKRAAIREENVALAGILGQLRTWWGYVDQKQQECLFFLITDFCVVYLFIELFTDTLCWIYFLTSKCCSKPL